MKLPESEERSPNKGCRTLTESLFLGELTPAKGEQVAALIHDLTQLGLVKRWGSSSVSIRLADPRETDQEFADVVFTTEGRSCLGWLSRVFLIN